MEIGFFFWPYDVALVRAMAEAADAFGYDMVGIADTPGNAMDPWVATTLLAADTRRARGLRDQPGHTPPRRLGGLDRFGGPARARPLSNSASGSVTAAREIWERPACRRASWRKA